MPIRASAVRTKTARPALAQGMILDFSYPREQLLAMHKSAAMLEVLDHQQNCGRGVEG